MTVESIAHAVKPLAHAVKPLAHALEIELNAFESFFWCHESASVSGSRDKSRTVRCRDGKSLAARHNCSIAQWTVGRMRVLRHCGAVGRGGIVGKRKRRAAPAFSRRGTKKAGRSAASA